MSNLLCNAFEGEGRDMKFRLQGLDMLLIDGACAIPVQHSCISSMLQYWVTAAGLPTDKPRQMSMLLKMGRLLDHMHCCPVGCNCRLYTEGAPQAALTKQLVGDLHQYTRQLLLDLFPHRLLPPLRRCCCILLLIITAAAVAAGLLAADRLTV